MGTYRYKKYKVKGFSLRLDLVERIEAMSAPRGINATEIVEAALDAYFAQLDAEAEAEKKVGRDGAA